MSKCPLCFYEVPVDHYMWALKNTGLEPVVDDVASRWLGAEVAYEAVLDLHQSNPDYHGPWPPDGRALAAEFAEPGTEVEGEICPHCHNPLPEHWRETMVTNVVMCGARASGKSLYIATAVKSLHQFLLRHGASVQMATAATERVYREHYEKPLFQEMGLMGATVAANTGADAFHLTPLIFSLGVDPVTRLRHMLVLRDVAGEELENPPAEDTHLDFMVRADTVIFMFDPLSVDAIRRRLQDLVPLDARSSGSATTVLDNLQRRIGVSARPPRVAVALSKFDVMQKLADINDAEWSRIMSNPGAAMMREPSYVQSFDLDESFRVHEEIRSLLLFMQAAEVVNKMERPHLGSPMPHQYFAVSALGDSPQGEKVSSHGIAPFRVLDPLLWAIDQQRQGHLR
ncbi:MULTISPECIES: TRAFAC clade GTPase domain-containing protein [Brevibacterium]|uniref:Double-GTPase 2 domain-containing protein n=1 Tax=Brevibacterium salitolerans TaxID=1403566 RepID=A0ABN2X2R1_9MICO|nr:hypothetical protein [Brevibacterium sp.]